MRLIRTAEELHDLRARPRRLLAVFAHPDDEAYGCAGALARYGARADTATVLLCLTRGEAASVGRERGLTPDELGAIRERRLEAVADRVGLDGLLVPGLPDGRLARLAPREVASPIREAVEAFRPHVLVTGDARGVNGHADHIAVHWASRRALEDRADVRFAMLAYPPEVAEAAKPRLLFATSEEEIDAVLTLTESEIDAKEACLAIHEAVISMRGEDGRPTRPPLERFDLLGERHDPPLADLFEGLAAEPA